MSRFTAMFKARVLEVLRDRSALAWNLLFAPLLVIGMALVFSGRPGTAFSVGILVGAPDVATLNPLAGDDAIHLQRLRSLEVGLTALHRQNLDAVIDLRSLPLHAWINQDSDKSNLLRSLLQLRAPTAQIATVHGAQINHANWLVPGLLGINIMFSSLFAIGHVIVRYRKSGYLKRLKGTPLRAMEFIGAQLAACLAVIVTVATGVFLACKLLLHLQVAGSYLDLLLVTVLGAMSMIAMSLLVSARISSEELSGGLLNLLSWPMVVLSGAFFPLDGAPRPIRALADVFPLTPMLRAARAVMLDGAGLADIRGSLLTLALMTLLFFALGARLFRWMPD